MAKCLLRSAPGEFLQALIRKTAAVDPEDRSPDPDNVKPSGQAVVKLLVSARLSGFIHNMERATSTPKDVRGSKADRRFGHPHPPKGYSA